MNFDFSAIFPTILESMGSFQPEIILGAGFLALVIIDLFLKKEHSPVIAILSLVVLLFSFIAVNSQAGENESIFFKMYVVDNFSVFFKYLFIISAFLTILISLFADELKENGRRVGEYFVLIIGLTFGMVLMAGASNLLMIFLSIEMVSLVSYILVSYLKEDKKSNEAGLKYVIYGAFSSGLMIYGMSLLYGLTGSLDLGDINRFLVANSVNPIVLTFSFILIFGGFGYKIAAVPFHFWSPDVYEGAPTAITAFLSVGPKAAGFAIILRFLHSVFISHPVTDGYATLQIIDWVGILTVISVLTMTVGNVIALWQSNVKRLLAYSSIAHAGYMLMGTVLLSDQGISAIMFYLSYYLLMNIAIFFAFILIANFTKSYELDDMKGMGIKAPILAIPIVILLASLTGIPGTVGFAGKFVLFLAVLEKGSLYFWLAVIAVLNSAISVFYYFKIAKVMFLKKLSDEDNQTKFDVPFAPAALLILLTIPVIVLGVYWQPIYDFAVSSAKMISL